MSHTGVIGVGDKLLFSSTADLHRFAKYTDGTAVIVGRNTGQQMVEFGARVAPRRPLIVISDHQRLNGTNGEDDKWIYYTKSLESALQLAETLAIELGLNGYTIAGGKQVYDEYLDMVDSGGKVRPNSAYIFSHDSEPASGGVKLKRDFAMVKKLMEQRMLNPSYVWHEADVLGKDHAGALVRAENGRFGFLCDKSVIDPDAVKRVGTQLRIDTDGGEVCISVYSIVGWSRRPDINSVDIRLTVSETITVRPRSKAALNSLLFALNMTAFN
jgi:dihydrofolate reductase